MKRNRSYKGKDDTTEHEMWILFWDYELPNLLRKQFNPKAKKNVPKDQFELTTYKICELKFYTDTFTNYRAIQDRLSLGKNDLPSNKTVSVCTN